MSHALVCGLSALGLLVTMLALLAAGQQLGRRRLTLDRAGAFAGWSSMQGAVFGLLGLLLAFTFSGAATRFEGRRQLIVEEANNIGTAWLRIDLLPDTVQPAVRDLFRRYLDARLEYYRVITDVDAAVAEGQRVAQLQTEIWNRALVAPGTTIPPATVILMATALNAMFDIASTRVAATENHPPTVIFGLLVALALACALLAGMGMAESPHPDRLHMLAFAGIISLSIYVVLDLEYPRLGLIRVDAFDHWLVDLRQSMR